MTFLEVRGSTESRKQSRSSAMYTQRDIKINTGVGAENREILLKTDAKLQSCYIVCTKVVTHIYLLIRFKKITKKRNWLVNV